MTVTALADIQAEADRLLTLSAGAGAMVRLIGGLAVAQHQHLPFPPPLRRTYADIDMVVKRGHDRLLREALETNGYTANRGFNSLHGDRRLLYYDEPNGRQLDVFVGVFAMSHALDLGARLDRDPRTLTPADLLLTKLQIVELNQKDIVDALALLLQHEVADERTGDVIGIDRLVQVTSRDWGWFTTFTDNLAKVRNAARAILDPTDVAQIVSRIDRILAGVVDSRKSVAWRIRARVGRRVTWYELPEEVGGKIRG